MKYHHHDPRKRKPSSSQQHKKPVGQVNKKPHLKQHVAEYVEKSVTRITVGLDLSPNKPLSKKELDRLRVELEGLKRQLSMDTVELSSPNSIDDEFLVTAASPILRSPVDSKDGLNKSNFMIPSVSSTDRLKQFGRIKKKSKLGEVGGNSNSTEFQKKIKQELHDQRAFDFRESRLLRSSIFEQDLERLESSKHHQDEKQVKEMLQCWRVNGTSEINLLFAGSRFLEPLPEPDNATNGNGHLFPILNPLTVGNIPNNVNSTKLSNSTVPKNVYPLSISELPASAESEDSNIAGKTCGMSLDVSNSDTEEQDNDNSLEPTNCNTSISATVQEEDLACVTSQAELSSQSLENEKSMQNDLEVLNDLSEDVKEKDDIEETHMEEETSNLKEVIDSNQSDPGNINELSTKEIGNEVENVVKANKIEDVEEDLILSSEDEHIMEVGDMLESAGEVLIESAEQVLEDENESDQESKIDSSLVSTLDDSSVIQQYEESISDEPFVEEVVIPCEDVSHQDIKKEDMSKSQAVEELEHSKNLEEILNVVPETLPKDLCKPETQENKDIVKPEVDHSVELDISEKIADVTVEQADKTDEKETTVIAMEELPPKKQSIAHHESTPPKSRDKEKRNDERKNKLSKESKIEKNNKELIKSIKKDKEKKKKKTNDLNKSSKEKSSMHDAKGKLKDSFDKKLLKSKKEKHRTETKPLKVKEVNSSQETLKTTPNEAPESSSQPTDIDGDKSCAKNVHTKPIAKLNSSESKVNLKGSEQKTSSGITKLKKKKRKHESEKIKSSKSEKDSTKPQKLIQSKPEKEFNVENDKLEIKSTGDDVSKKNLVKTKSDKSKSLSVKSNVTSGKDKSDSKNKHKELKSSKSHKMAKKGKHDSPSKLDSIKKSKSKFVKSSSSLLEPESKKPKLSNSVEGLTKEHKKTKKSLSVGDNKRSRYALIYDTESDSEKFDEVVKSSKDSSVEENKKSSPCQVEKEAPKESSSISNVKQPVQLSLSTSSSNSSEFNDGPPPVPQSAMVMTETLKNETIMPTDYVKSECLSSTHLKESSLDRASGSSKESDSKKKSQKTHMKKDTPSKSRLILSDTPSKSRLILSSSEFSNSDDESDSISLKEIRLNKNLENVKLKQSFKQSLKSALFSASSGDSSDSSDDLSEIPLKSSPKKRPPSQKPTSKSISLHKKVAKFSVDVSKIKTPKLNSSQSVECKSKSENKEKGKLKDKHLKVGKTSSDIASSKPSKNDGKLVEKKKKHKHNQKEHSREKKEFGSSSIVKKDSKIILEKHATKIETVAQIAKDKEFSTSSKHDKTLVSKDGHAVVKKHRNDSDKSHGKVKSKFTSSVTNKPSHASAEPAAEKLDKKLKILPTKPEEKKMPKKKHQNPFLQRKKEQVDKLSSTSAKQSSSNESRKKLDKPKSMFNSDSEEEKEVYKKKAAKPFEGWKNLETKIKLKDESNKPTKDNQDNKSFTAFRKNSDYFGTKPISQDKSIDSKIGDLDEDHIDENHESPKVGKLSIVESPDPVVEKQGPNNVKRDAPTHNMHRERPSLAKTKHESPVRSQDEEAVMSIVGLNKDFEQNEETFTKRNNDRKTHKPKLKEKTHSKFDVKTDVKKTVKPDVDDSISAADRELAAAVSSIEFGFGDFQRSKTPTMENFTNLPSTFPSVEPKKETSTVEVVSTSESSLTEDDHRDMSQEDEAARAANALLKFSADEDSSFEFPSVKMPSPKADNPSPVEKLPKSIDGNAPLSSQSKKQTHKHKSFVGKPSLNPQETGSGSSRKRRRLSKDEFTSKAPNGEMVMAQEPKQARVENFSQISQKPDQPVQSLARSPTTWQPFIPAPKYSPTLPAQPLINPHAVRKMSQEHISPDIATARRTSLEPEQSSFAHPKVPNISRRKSSTSPTVSPTAGRPMFSPYDPNLDKSLKHQSPGIGIPPVSNAPAIMRHEGSGSIVVSPSQQHFSARIPFPPRPSLSPKTTTAIPYLGQMQNAPPVLQQPQIPMHHAISTGVSHSVQMQPLSTMNRSMAHHQHSVSSHVTTTVQSPTAPFSSHAMHGYPYLAHSMQQYTGRPAHHIGVPTYPGGITYQSHQASTSPKETLHVNTQGQRASQPVSSQHPGVMMQQKPLQTPSQPQSVVQSPGSQQQRVAQSPIAHQQRVPQSPGHPKTIVQSPGSHQQILIQSPGAHPQRVAQSPGAHQQRVVQSPGAHQQRVAQSPGAHQQRVVQSPGAHQQRVVQSPGAHQQRVVQSPGAHQQRVAPSPSSHHRVPQKNIIFASSEVNSV